MKNDKKVSGLVVTMFGVACAACSSSSTYAGLPDGGTDTTSEGTSKGTLACQQKQMDGQDSDCSALGKPRKLDCAYETELAAALAAGCVREDPKDADDFDVCCPKTVSGTEVVTASLACREKEDAVGARECSTYANSKPKKLDCDTETNVKAALAAGCVRESATSTDVCCALTVEGTPD